MRYVVTRYETTDADYAVEADSPEEAVQRLRAWDAEHVRKLASGGDYWSDNGDPYRIICENDEAPGELDWRCLGEMDGWTPVGPTEAGEAI